MNYETFINDQKNLMNIAKAYKNNAEFKEKIDKNPKAIFATLPSFAEEVKICWNTGENYFFILPPDPSIGICDEQIDTISAAKFDYIRADADNRYFHNNRGNAENYRVPKNQKADADGLVTFIRVDLKGNDIANTAFQAYDPYHRD